VCARAQSVVLEVALRHATRAHAMARWLAEGALRPARAVAAPLAAATGALARPLLAAVQLLLLGPLRALRRGAAAAAAALALLHASAAAAWCVASRLHACIVPLRACVRACAQMRCLLTACTHACAGLRLQPRCAPPSLLPRRWHARCCRLRRARRRPPRAAAPQPAAWRR
jgi:hypothetical protein